MFEILSYSDFETKEKGVAKMYVVLTSELHKVSKYAKNVKKSFPYIFFLNGKIYVTDGIYVLAEFNFCDLEHEIVDVRISDFTQGISQLHGGDTVVEILDDGVALYPKDNKEKVIFLKKQEEVSFEKFEKALEKRNLIKNYVLVDKKELEIAMNIFGSEVEMTYDKMLNFKDVSKEVALFDTLLSKEDDERILAGKYLTANFKIRFNPKFLREFLQAISDKQNIRLGIIGNTEPIFVFSKEGCFAFMPMKSV